MHTWKDRLGSQASKIPPSKWTVEEAASTKEAGEEGARLAVEAMIQEHQLRAALPHAHQQVAGVGIAVHEAVPKYHLIECLGHYVGNLLCQATSPTPLKNFPVMTETGTRPLSEWPAASLPACRLSKSIFFFKTLKQTVKCPLDPNHPSKSGKPVDRLQRTHEG